MNENVVYEYAVIRIVPRVEREEFINAGLILFSKKKNIILCKTLIEKNKIYCFVDQPDLNAIELNLQSFEKIARGEDCESPVARLDVSSRFRWLTAPKSTIIQCSPVHPGITKLNNFEEIFNNLFQKLVM